MPRTGHVRVSTLALARARQARIHDDLVAEETCKGLGFCPSHCHRVSKVSRLTELERFGRQGSAETA